MDHVTTLTVTAHGEPVTLTLTETMDGGGMPVIAVNVQTTVDTQLFLNQREV